MTKKPRGAKYRNLTRRGGVIYYERVTHGQRFRISTKTNDWTEAASFRDLFEAHEGIGRVPFLTVEVPRFADFAARYLAEATEDLAGTTREDRMRLLRPDGPIVRGLGMLRLDDITRPRLLEWYQAELAARGRSHSTGVNYLSAVSGVLRYAVDLDLLSENPVDALRVTLRQRRRTKRDVQRTNTARSGVRSRKPRRSPGSSRPRSEHREPSTSQRCCSSTVTFV